MKKYLSSVILLFLIKIPDSKAVSDCKTCLTNSACLLLLKYTVNTIQTVKLTMSNREGLRENPKPTPEGRAFQLQNVSSNRDELTSYLKERIVFLDDLMKSTNNHQLVKSELSNLDLALQEFLNILFSVILV